MTNGSAETAVSAPSGQRDTHLGRPFSVLWSSSTISTLGDGVRTTAFPLLAAAITKNPVAVSLVAVAGQVPWILTSLLGGAIADRQDRRRLMWAVDIFRGLASFALASAVLVSHATVVVLCAVAFILGVGQTLFDNASHALLPSVVDRDLIPAANNRLFTTRIVINSFVGPPLGGLLFATYKSSPFFLDAASFAAASILVGLVLRPRRETQAAQRKTSLRADIIEGIRFVRQTPMLYWAGAFVAVVNFTQAATQAILVLFALEDLGVKQTGYGLLVATMGIGGLIGGLSGGMLRRLLPTGTLFAATVIITVPIFVIIGLTSNPCVAGSMLALNSIAGINANVLLSSLRQHLVPNELLARVNSVMGMLGMGVGLPLGSLAGGLLAHAAGLRAPFFVSAALVALLAFSIPPMTRAFAAMASQNS